MAFLEEEVMLTPQLTVTQSSYSQAYASSTSPKQIAPTPAAHQAGVPYVSERSSQEQDGRAQFGDSSPNPQQGDNIIAQTTGRGKTKPTSNKNHQPADNADISDLCEAVGSLSLSSQPCRPPQPYTFAASLKGCTEVKSLYDYLRKHITSLPDYKRPRRAGPNFTIKQWRMVDDQQIIQWERQLKYSDAYSTEAHARHTTAMFQMREKLREWRNQQEWEIAEIKRALHPNCLTRVHARDVQMSLKEEGEVEAPADENEDYIPYTTAEKGKGPALPTIQITPATPPTNSLQTFQKSLDEQYARRLQYDEHNGAYLEGDLEILEYDDENDYYIDDLDEVWAELMRLPTAKSDEMGLKEWDLYCRYYGLNQPWIGDEDEEDFAEEEVEIVPFRREVESVDEGNPKGRSSEDMIFLWAARHGVGEKMVNVDVEGWEEKVLETVDQIVEGIAGLPVEKVPVEEVLETVGEMVEYILESPDEQVVSENVSDEFDDSVESNSQSTAAEGVVEGAEGAEGAEGGKATERREKDELQMLREYREKFRLATLRNREIYRYF